MDWNYIDINKELNKLRAEQQNKLNIGRDKLSKAGDDPDLLGSALISYHGALEDHIRASLVAEVPEGIRQKILSHSTEWKDLLDYSKKYLSLTRKDADLISEANFNRNDVAHGKAFKWDKDKLFSYVTFVENWCSREIKPVSTQSTWQPSYSKPSNVTKPETREETDYEPYPFWRSSCFLWLTFIFFNPLWAILILTDRYQSGVLKFVVGLIYSGVIILFLWGLSIQNKFQPYIPRSSNSTTQTVDTDFLQTEQVTKATKQYMCTIIWEKYSDSSDLVNKNRSMVWDETVSYLVEGSEMTPREFYDQVVERNPSLAVDGYVFKEGQVYLLPRCE